MLSPTFSATCHLRCYATLLRPRSAYPPLGKTQAASGRRREARCCCFDACSCDIGFKDSWFAVCTAESAPCLSICPRDLPRMLDHLPS